MSNTERMKLTKLGKMIITKGGIRIPGFDAENVSCQEVTIMIFAWARLPGSFSVRF
ncbi:MULTISPECIES: hypothetical protein [unclassified Pseudomonas]|uniref:hypothetical protein n=1 Tax=unclassified Pseudomonas TaxID=196821 RepID=UPI001314924C|nr:MULTISPECIES: hypothetical protein [unclassified Pseudomonas]